MYTYSDIKLYIQMYGMPTSDLVPKLKWTRDPVNSRINEQVDTMESIEEGMVTVYPKVSLLVGLKEIQTQVLSFYDTVIH